MALVLKRRGITRIRPLAGGIDAWRARNFPVDGVKTFFQHELGRAPAAQEGGGNP